MCRRGLATEKTVQPTTKERKCGGILSDENNQKIKLLLQIISISSMQWVTPEKSSDKKFCSTKSEIAVITVIYPSC
jgi:hypothetical protein